jgi:hypothetical protein
MTLSHGILLLLELVKTNMMIKSITHMCIHYLGYLPHSCFQAEPVLVASLSPITIALINHSLKVLNRKLQNKQ